MWTKYMDYFQFSRIQVKLGSLLLMTVSHMFACIFALIAKLNSLVDPRNDEYSYAWLAQAGLTDEPWFFRYAAAMYLRGNDNNSRLRRYCAPNDTNVCVPWLCFLGSVLWLLLQV